VRAGRAGGTDSNPEQFPRITWPAPERVFFILSELPAKARHGKLARFFAQMTRQRLFEILMMDRERVTALIARHAKRGNTRALSLIVGASRLFAREYQAVRAFGYVPDEGETLDMIRRCCRAIRPPKPIGRAIRQRAVRLRA
jgi:hypothetical protein